MDEEQKNLYKRLDHKKKLEDYPLAGGSGGGVLLEPFGDGGNLLGVLALCLAAGDEVEDGLLYGGRLCLLLGSGLRSGFSLLFGNGLGSGLGDRLYDGGGDEFCGGDTLAGFTREGELDAEEAGKLPVTRHININVAVVTAMMVEVSLKVEGDVAGEIDIEHKAEFDGGGEMVLYIDRSRVEGTPVVAPHLVGTYAADEVEVEGVVVAVVEGADEVGHKIDGAGEVLEFVGAPVLNTFHALVAVEVEACTEDRSPLGADIGAYGTGDDITEVVAVEHGLTTTLKSEEGMGVVLCLFLCHSGNDEEEGDEEKKTPSYPP